MNMCRASILKKISQSLETPEIAGYGKEDNTFSVAARTTDPQLCL